MKKKVLITGPEGFLGSRIAAAFEHKHQVVRAGHKQMDITDEKQVLKVFMDSRPEVVIHCAAISNTGACQRKPLLSEAVNVAGAVNVARASREAGCKMVFMSSDQIYGGSTLDRPNRERDEAPLVNVYGKQKKMAEDMILGLLPEAVCLRLTWLYDLPAAGLKINENFLVNLLKAVKERQPITLPVYDFRGMTWTEEVVEQLEPAISLPGGIYNFGSEASLSSYEIGKQVMSFLNPENKAGDLILPDESRFHDSPRNLTMDTEKARNLGIGFSETVQGLLKCLRGYSPL